MRGGGEMWREGGLEFRQSACMIATDIAHWSDLKSLRDRTRDEDYYFTVKRNDTNKKIINGF